MTSLREYDIKFFSAAWCGIPCRRRCVSSVCGNVVGRSHGWVEQQNSGWYGFDCGPPPHTAYLSLVDPVAHLKLLYSPFCSYSPRPRHALPRTTARTTTYLAAGSALPATTGMVAPEQPPPIALAIPRLFWRATAFRFGGTGGALFM